MDPNNSDHGNLFKWNQPNENIGYDIDKKSFFIQGEEYGDYDVLRTAKVSGDSYIIPANEDLGIPQEVKSGEKDYMMKEFINIDQAPYINEMLENVNNGRVHDIKKETKRELPTNNDRIMVKDNQESSIRGLLEDNPLNTLFFSDENINAIQMGLRYGVYKRIKKIISKQSENELYIIMRSIMLQYGKFQVSSEDLINEVRDLNSKVLVYAIDNISANTQQYIEYIDDLSKLKIPMDRPQYLNKNNYTYDMSNILER